MLKEQVLKRFLPQGGGGGTPGDRTDNRHTADEQQKPVVDGAFAWGYSPINFYNNSQYVS